MTERERKEWMILGKSEGMSTDEVEFAVKAFDLYDKDGSGEIDEEELNALFYQLSKNKMKPKLVKRYTEMRFSMADKDKSGSIDLREFIPLFNQFIKEKKISLNNQLMTEIEAMKDLSLDDIENNRVPNGHHNNNDNNKDDNNNDNNDDNDNNNDNNNNNDNKDDNNNKEEWKEIKGEELEEATREALDKLRVDISEFIERTYDGFQNYHGEIKKIEMEITLRHLYCQFCPQKSEEEIDADVEYFLARFGKERLGELNDLEYRSFCLLLLSNLFLRSLSSH